MPSRLTLNGRLPLHRAALPAALLLALMLDLCMGCRNEAPRPKPEPRYRTLGPKTDFPAYFTGTILELVDVYGLEPVRVSGYGLVVNLENTGRNDGIPTAVREAVMNTAAMRGVGSHHTPGALGELSAAQLLNDPRSAIVRVEGIVPPGARDGQRIDVWVKALETNTTTSLARGELWRTELHSGIVTPQNPGERVNLVGQARGRLSVNPVYALEDPLQVRELPDAQASLRFAYVQDGGIFNSDRVIILKLREPSWRTSRAIERRINLHFGAPERSPVAAAQDEGVVHLRLPAEYRGDWPRFVGVTTTLFFYGVNKQYALERAEALIEAATDPKLDPMALEGISYALEGLGSVVVAKLLPLFSDPNPAVAFWMARAAAFNEEPAALDTLVRIASEPQNPWAVAAAETLGKLRHSTGSVVRRLHELLNVPAPEVRVAAYRSLLAIEPGAVNFVEIGDKTYGKQFYLDRVNSKAEPVIWASRIGTPRLAIIGDPPRLRPGALAAAFGNRLTISVDAAGNTAAVFHRPVTDHNSSVTILADATELAATLGGETRPGNVPIRLGYGDVIAVLKRMCDEGQIIDAQGRQVRMILQDVAVDLVEDAPSIPGLENAQAPGESAAAARAGGGSLGNDAARSAGAGATPAAPPASATGQ